MSGFWRISRLFVPSVVQCEGSAAGLNWVKKSPAHFLALARRCPALFWRQFAGSNRQNALEVFACASPASAHALIKVESFCSPGSSRVRETGGMASWSR
jgi:hypothetical protein